MARSARGGQDEVDSSRSGDRTGRMRGHRWEEASETRWAGEEEEEDAWKGMQATRWIGRRKKLRGTR
jgi:hypothetical protein